MESIKRNQLLFYQTENISQNCLRMNDQFHLHFVLLLLINSPGKEKKYVKASIKFFVVQFAQLIVIESEEPLVTRYCQVNEKRLTGTWKMC